MPPHPHPPHPVARTLEAEWQRLCGIYLPLRPPGSLWWSSRPLARHDLAQGWKLHISATILSAGAIFRSIAPCLAQQQLFFKAPKSLVELQKLNSGVHYGFAQAGKFVTIYPPSAEAAVALAWELDQLTARQPAPLIAYDEPLRPGSCVYYRFGQFKPHAHVNVRGQRVPAILHPAGHAVADRREPGAAVPRWLADPFLPKKPRARALAASPLESRFGEFVALVQRGRGGVYRARDYAGHPARMCLIKEGRPHGETDWLGRDGVHQIQREARFLKLLSPSLKALPRFITTFQTNDGFYLVMEHIAGRNLQDVITSRLPISVRRTLGYALSMARILADIHSAGWAWLDCKPGNFLCGKNGALRAIDFETACEVENLNPLWMGTPGYLPPQRHEASWLADDLYGLGASLAQLAARTAAPPPLNTVVRARQKLPAVFLALIKQLRQPDPRKRPPARLVQQTLARLISNHNSSSAP